MNSYREWLDPGGGTLASRLDHLSTTLEMLGSRLRGAVADAVSESVAGFVRDALLTTLTRLAGRSLDPKSRLLPKRSWDEPTRLRETEEQDERDMWTDDRWQEEEEPESLDEVAPVRSQTSPSRVTRSVTAGLQAAAWWLHGTTRGRPALATLAVGLLVGLVAFAVPALATAAFGVVASAGQLAVLSAFSPG